MHELGLPSSTACRLDCSYSPVPPVQTGVSLDAALRSPDVHKPHVLPSQGGGVQQWLMLLCSLSGGAGQRRTCSQGGCSCGRCIGG